MGSGHDHDHGTSTASATALTRALVLTGGFLIVEVIAGILTNSLALLSDAAHMLTDTAGIAIALAAIKIGERPADSRRTFGYRRFEILAAALNSILLFLAAAYILYEAWRRLIEPSEIDSLPMLAVAFTGLLVNIAAMRILAPGKDVSLNVKGAYLEVWSDMLGSVGVIVAALLMMWKGWTIADPIIGAGIGLFIVPRTWSLLKQAVHILLEGTPPEVDMALLKAKLSDIPGVVAVDDLHVWTLTSGLDAMSCHLVVDDMTKSAAILTAASAAMRSEFGLTHTTIQIEDEAIRGAPGHVTRL